MLGLASIIQQRDLHVCSERLDHLAPERQALGGNECQNDEHLVVAELLQAGEG
ncbi:hypothetical protein [Shimia sp. R9_3]|uniref:hypothetical protein n=1 Tax=Shimia sp. R9_3 TaxID=2821113 RepID=UPI001ADA50B0|nr:hypothetical protein [Shimia sp. R9_3]